MTTDKWYMDYDSTTLRKNILYTFELLWNILDSREVAEIFLKSYTHIVERLL